MRNFRLLIVALATICVLALGVYGLVHRPPVQDPGDDIIIKGGSLDITCGSNQGAQCLAYNANTGKYEHKKSAHVTKIVVMDSHYKVLYDSSDPNHCGGGSFDNKSEVHITYK
jgi:hypothetical protein